MTALPTSAVSTAEPRPAVPTAESRPAVPTAEPRAVTPVSILAAQLEHIDDLLSADAGASPHVRAEVRRAWQLARGLDPYLAGCTTPESPALQAIVRRTHAENWTARSGDTGLEAEMLSGHVEGQTLKFLVHATGATRVLEIGMFTGYSALAMAEALPSDGVVVACELDPYVAALAQECFDDSPDGRKISVRIGPALATLAQLASDQESFQLVFIDADKGGYRDYLDLVLGGELLAPNGLVCVDNTLMQGQPYLPGTPTVNGAAIAAFNQWVADDPRTEQVLLPLRDGLTLIRRVDR